MSNIETPEEFCDRIAKLGYGAIEYADPAAEDELLCAISERDAAIRADSASLLKMCGEALEDARNAISCPDGIKANFLAIEAMPSIDTALAALREKGVIE